MRTFILILLPSLLSLAPPNSSQDSDEVSKLKARIAQLEEQLKASREREIPTMPVSYIVSHGVDGGQLAHALTKATIPIFHSIGERRVRAGRVTLLGIEKNYVVGFTTSCTVTRQHPWPSELERSERFNEIIVIKPPDSSFDYYLTEESEIAEDKGTAFAKAISQAKIDPSIVNVDSKENWKSTVEVQEGDYVEIQADEDADGKPQGWSAKTNGEKCGPEGYRNSEGSPYAVSSDHPLACLLVAHSGDSKGKGFVFQPYAKGGIGFFVRRSGSLAMCMNDTDRSNNSGRLRVEVRIGDR